MSEFETLIGLVSFLTKIYEFVRPSGTHLSDPVCSEDPISPVSSTNPDNRISAIASIIPDPHIPVIRTPLQVSSDNQSSCPIILKNGVLVIGSIFTLSIAPGAARCPQVICAPSKAGPVGDEQARSFSLFPKIISAFVPTSTIREISLFLCGFSAKVTQILFSYDVEFSYIDVLEFPEVRANLPKISDWPTFPQLFVDGDLIGGCDIVTEMHENDELSSVLS